MGKILISNIGNRNLLFRNRYFTDGKFKCVLNAKEIEYAKDFYKFTKYLYENIYELESEITPTLLDVLLNEKFDETDKVILFTSNQKEDKRKDQDTYYEGYILKYLFEKLYPGIEVDVKVLTCPVTDNNQLMRTYTGHYNQLKKEYPDKPIIYCDAGGTAQQKFASKIMLEYLFKDDQYEVYYVSKGKGGKSELFNSEPVEYRNIIDKEHIKQTIAIGEYYAALNVLKFRGVKAMQKNVADFIEFASLRRSLIINEAQKSAKNLSQVKAFRESDIIINYTSGEPLGDYDLFKDIFSKKAFFKICEILELADFELQIERYSNLVLRISQFIESYLSYVLENFGYRLKKSANNYAEESNKIAAEAKQRFPNVNRQWADEKIVPGIPLYIKIAENIDHKLNQQVMDIFLMANSYLSNYKEQKVQKEFKFKGIDAMRNKYAHEGRFVRKEELIAQPYYNKLLSIRNILGFEEKNVYYQMNSLIEHNL